MVAQSAPRAGHGAGRGLAPRGQVKSGAASTPASIGGGGGGGRRPAPSPPGAGAGPGPGGELHAASAARAITVRGPTLRGCHAPAPLAIFRVYGGGMQHHRSTTLATRAALVLAATAALALAATPEADARPRPRSRKFEANKTFGLGIMLGAPSGLSGKYFYGRSTAFDFGVGAVRYWRNRDGLHLHFDHLWHPVSLAHDRAFELPLYVGIGARIFDFDGGGSAIGLRAPIGIAFDFNNVPLDIFVELALVIDTFVDYDGDRYDGDVNGAVGLRYYFGS